MDRRSSNTRLNEVAVADHLYMCLAAKGAALRPLSAIVVMPGVGETDRIVGAFALAARTGCARMICTGTNVAERARGEVYDEERLYAMSIETGFTMAYGPSRRFRIEAYVEGEHSRMQAENAIRALKADLPRGPIAHVAGPWHGPRSYLTFLQALREAFGSFDEMPIVLPALVPVPLAQAPSAASMEHLSSGYAEGLPNAIAAEIERRIRYEDAGHVMPLMTFVAYFSHVSRKV